MQIDVNRTLKRKTIKPLRHVTWFCLMAFNATFKNSSVISWRSVLFVEENGVPGKNHRPVASHWQTLSHNVVHLALIEIRTHNISIDCIGSCKSNYHKMTATTAPWYGICWYQYKKSPHIVFLTRMTPLNLYFLLTAVTSGVTYSFFSLLIFPFSPPEKWVYTSFSPGKVSIYSFFPPEGSVYTHFFPRKDQYILIFPPDF